MHSFIFSKNNVKKSSSCYNGRRLTTAGHCAHITGHYFVVWVPSRPGSAQKTSGKGEPRFAPLSHSNILSFQIVNFAKNIVGNLCYYKKESGLNIPFNLSITHRAVSMWAYRGVLVCWQQKFQLKAWKWASGGCRRTPHTSHIEYICSGALH